VGWCGVAAESAPTPHFFGTATRRARIEAEKIPPARTSIARPWHPPLLVTDRQSWCRRMISSAITTSAKTTTHFMGGLPCWSFPARTVGTTAARYPTRANLSSPTKGLSTGRFGRRETGQNTGGPGNVRRRTSARHRRNPSSRLPPPVNLAGPHARRRLRSTSSIVAQGDIESAIPDTAPRIGAALRLNAPGFFCSVSPVLRLRRSLVHEENSEPHTGVMPLFSRTSAGRLVQTRNLAKTSGEALLFSCCFVAPVA